MPVTVTIEYPLPGTTLTPSIPPPPPPGVHMKGVYTVDNVPLDKIVCRVIYPATSGVTPLVWSQDADHAASGKWDVTFASLPEALNVFVQAEIFVQGVAAPQENDTVEDIDILANSTVGTINPPAPIAPLTPMP